MRAVLIHGAKLLFQVLGDLRSSKPRRGLPEAAAPRGAGHRPPAPSCGSCPDVPAPLQRAVVRRSLPARLQACGGRGAWIPQKAASPSLRAGQAGTAPGAVATARAAGSCRALQEPGSTPSGAAPRSPVGRRWSRSCLPRP